MLAIGRDISERRAGEVRMRALAAMGERALAGADPADLAAEAVELMRTTLPIAGAAVRLAGGATLASDGPTTEASIRLPIGTGDELLVALERELADEEMSFVRAVANTLASALARLRGEERMRYEAVHDPLTELANRTLLRDRLEHALARSEREGGATGVLFVDLDNFKQVNDAYGHATGDAVLVQLGRRLRTRRSPGRHDRASRRRRVRRRVRAGRRGVGPGARPASAGCDPAAAHGRRRRAPALGKHRDRVRARRPDALLGDADAAVYRAKANGRGRVELF